MSGGLAGTHAQFNLQKQWASAQLHEHAAWLAQVELYACVHVCRPAAHASWAARVCGPAAHMARGKWARAHYWTVAWGPMFYVMFYLNFQ